MAKFTYEPRESNTSGATRAHWARQLSARGIGSESVSPSAQPTPIHTPTPAAPVATRPPSTESVWAKQFAPKAQSPANRTPARDVWARQFAAPAPAANSPLANIRAAVAPLGIRPGSAFSGIRACADTAQRARSLIAAGDVSSLLTARELIQQLPADHPQGWGLVRACCVAMVNAPVAT